MLAYDHKHSEIDYSKGTKETYRVEQWEVVCIRKSWRQDWSRRRNRRWWRNRAGCTTTGGAGTSWGWSASITSLERLKTNHSLMLKSVANNVTRRPAGGSLN